jgi:DNA-binding transcriptional ArsR family regulator
MLALLHALSAPRRREIVRLLWRRERTVGGVQAALGDVTIGAVSQHLKVLRDAGLVERRVLGRHRTYVARRDELGPFRDWLEASWDDALYRLKIRAEIEEARRGPRAGARRPRRASAGSPRRPRRASARSRR